MPVLSVRSLSIDYMTRRGPVHAVRNVSFDLEKSETLAIIGESGSGKTTLAVGLIRLSPRGTRVTSGEILYTKNGLTTDENSGRRRSPGVPLGRSRHGLPGGA